MKSLRIGDELFGLYLPSAGTSVERLRLARELFWGQIYAEVFRNLGTTATILAFGDTKLAGATTASTFTTVRDNASGVEASFTWSEAPSGWDTRFNLQHASNWRGCIPVLTFNGTDEEADTPDAAYWTVDDSGGAGPFSLGAWIRPTDVTDVVLLCRHDGTTGAELREWRWKINDSSKLILLLTDESANVTASRPSSASITANQWQFVVVTYDGGGGATAADGINLYINGAVSNGSATNNASYVAMEDLATTTKLGFQEGSGGTNEEFFAGAMAGGPLGPFFTKAQLSAAQVKNLYRLGVHALGLG